MVDKNEFLKYYEQGLKDSEIARILKVAECSVGVLRREMNLPTNGRKVISDEEFYKYYNKGLWDAEIARLTGASASQITRRRVKYGLPPHEKPRTFTKEQFLEKYNEGLNDREIAIALNSSKTATQDFRAKLGLPPVDKNKETKEIIEKLYKEGKTDNEILKEVNYTCKTSVARTRKKLGLSRERKTPLEYNLSSEQFQVVLGSLLGDGNISKKYKNGGGILRIAHCKKQKEYCEYKRQFFLDISSELREINCFDERFKDPNYTEYMFYTNSVTCLADLYKSWYTPKKHVVKEDVYKLEPLGLAIWFMDDGTRHKIDKCYRLCTNGFSLEDVQILQEMLKVKWGIESTITKRNEIYIKACSKKIFEDLIRPYIIPNMLYKLNSPSKTV